MYGALCVNVVQKLCVHDVGDGTLRALPTRAYVDGSSPTLLHPVPYRSSHHFCKYILGCTKIMIHAFVLYLVSFLFDET